MGKICYECGNMILTSEKYCKCNERGYHKQCIQKASMTACYHCGKEFKYIKHFPWYYENRHFLYSVASLIFSMIQIWKWQDCDSPTSVFLVMGMASVINLTLTASTLISADDQMSHFDWPWALIIHNITYTYLILRSTCPAVLVFSGLFMAPLSIFNKVSTLCSVKPTLEVVPV